MSEVFIRATGFLLFVVFVSVGALFLLEPEVPLNGLNSMGDRFGMEVSPLHGTGFYSVMTSAYMAVVAILAFRIFRQPEIPHNSLLLAQAKMSSSLFSFGAYLLHRPDFILLANGFVDGGLALLALFIYRGAKQRGMSKGSS